MLFRPELVAKILAGEKTMTRRAVKPDDEAFYWMAEGPMLWDSTCSFPMDGVQRRGRVLWQVGRTYAVQPGRGKPRVADFLLEGIRYCERAGDIAPEDAIAEGFASPDAFRDVYGRINGVGALERPAWALTFALIGEATP